MGYKGMRQSVDRDRIVKQSGFKSFENIFIIPNRNSVPRKPGLPLTPFPGLWDPAFHILPL